jgi:hypothetical protein
MQLLIMKQDRNVHLKGDIVEIRATGTPFAGLEPQSFVMVEVEDTPMTNFRNFNREWAREIAFDVVASDPEQDGYRLKMYSTTATATKGQITKDEVQTFIENWGGSVVSFAANEVRFDITIYAALTSQAFWELENMSASVVFTELSYDQTTGGHRIQADYSALGNNPSYVESYVERMGLDIVSHANKILVYDADRSVVKAAFQDDLKEKAKKQIARRRYHIPANVVDTIISNGGSMSVPLATAQNYITDKVAE